VLLLLYIILFILLCCYIYIYKQDITITIIIIQIMHHCTSHLSVTYHLYRYIVSFYLYVTIIHCYNIYIYIYKSLYVISAIYNVTISHYKSRYAHIYMSLYVISSIYYYKYVPIIYMSYIYHHIIVSPIYHHITITNTSSSFFSNCYISPCHYTSHVSLYHPYITHISPIYHPYITHISPIYHHRFFRPWSSSPSWAAAAVNSSWHVRCVASGSCCRCRRSSPCAAVGWRWCSWGNHGFSLQLLPWLLVITDL